MPASIFHYWLRKTRDHPSPEIAFRETLTSADSNGTLLFFSPSTRNCSAGLPECFLVRVPFKCTGRSRVSWLVLAPTDHSFFFFLQRPETSELGERPRDPPTTRIRLLRLGWPPSSRRFGRPSRSSSASTSIHVPQAPFRRQTVLVLR